MSKVCDLSGQRYGRLVALERVQRTGRVKWRCQCACGGETQVYPDQLKAGKTRSCGCLKREVTGKINRKHGKSRSPEYQAWLHMRLRCYAPTDRFYKDYGQRGIIVCDQWKNDFVAFFNDMGLRPDNCSLDRIDTNGHYEPTNCRWATAQQQMNNMRTNRLISYDGLILTVREWERHIGLRTGQLQQRLMAGWSTERALATPAGIFVPRRKREAVIN